MSFSGYIHLDVKLIKQDTELAFLLMLDNDENDEHWVPKSQIADPDEYHGGMENCTVSVKEWFCEKEGIEET